MEWMSEQSAWMNVVKRYKFLYRKISPLPIGMQNVHLSVGINWITFDWIVNLGQIFTVSTGQKLYHLVRWPSSWDPPRGPWSGKSPFPRILYSLWVFVLWGCDMPFFKPFNKPNNNQEPARFWILVATWNKGGQFPVNEGDSKNLT